MVHTEFFYTIVSLSLKCPRWCVILNPSNIIQLTVIYMLDLNHFKHVNNGLKKWTYLLYIAVMFGISANH